MTIPDTYCYNNKLLPCCDIFHLGDDHLINVLCAFPQIQEHWVSRKNAHLIRAMHQTSVDGVEDMVCGMAIASLYSPVTPIQGCSTGIDRQLRSSSLFDFLISCDEEDGHFYASSISSSETFCIFLPYTIRARMSL